MRARVSMRGVFRNFAERRGISTRLLVLFIVLFAVAVTLAPPTQHYFAQRAQISALESSVDSNRKKLEEARAELERWRDPEYIRSQARNRLHFVLPGERQYIILGVGTQAGDVSEGAAPINEDFPLGIPWYSRIISSITSVGVGSGNP
ncbi:MAG: septum formation initiator family protein [Actinobacteria bacterium]|jgi:cell division protein FtsB|nr:septum formation initiator family protein [Actinomycetota bacterium]NDA38631.1 septum formation initiator family protein [Actinomycetota bacterium]NDE83281.1 septum formation initiator family protein [Actinomycetota bacterium]